MKKLLLGLLVLSLLSCTPKRDVVELYSGKDGSIGAPGSPGLPGANGHSIVSQYNEVNSCECDQAGGSRLDLYLDLDDSLSASEGDLFQGSLIACNGRNGLQGIQGLQGVQGEVGAPGELGPQGIPGEQGPQGIAGVSGAQGIPGPVGATGAQGAPGPTGPAGAQGPAGSMGPAGPQGPAGAILTHVAISSSCKDTDDYSAIPAMSGRWIKRNGSTVTVYDDNDCGGSDVVFNLYSTHTSNGEASYWFSSTVLGFNDGAGNLRLIKFN